MFDIGFSELVLLSVIALVVLGPDRLPGALRTAGLWIGRLRRSFNSIKADIEREVGADEIRRQLRNEAIMEKIKATRSQVTQSIESVKQEAESVTRDLGLENTAGDAPATPDKPAPDTERPPPPPPPIAPAQSSAESTPAPAPEPVPMPSAQPVPEPVRQAGHEESGQNK